MIKSSPRKRGGKPMGTTDGYLYVRRYGGSWYVTPECASRDPGGIDLNMYRRYTDRDAAVEVAEDMAETHEYEYGIVIEGTDDMKNLMKAKDRDVEEVKVSVAGLLDNMARGFQPIARMGNGDRMVFQWQYNAEEDNNENAQF